MRWLLILAAAAAALGILRGATAAAETVVNFDPARGEFPEGIAFGRDGSMYVSLAPLGIVRRFAEDGSSADVFTVNPGTTGLGILGLAAGGHGVLYAAVPSDAPSAHGVWAFGPNEEAHRLPGSEQMVFPNAIAIDRQGTLYVTDSILGAIWRIRDGQEPELWLRHESLAGLAEINPFPLGANGIAYDGHRLLVANTEKKQIVAVPIEYSGEAGTPQVVHAFSDYLDGVALDVAGNLYVAVAGRNEVVRVDRSGNETTVGTAQDGLSMPASLAFATRGTAKRTLYVTNLSLPSLVPVAMPSVVAIDVPLPGPPVA
jgi:DNA-binding beta-propeller fold protein YncE